LLGKVNFLSESQYFEGFVFNRLTKKYYELIENQRMHLERKAISSKLNISSQTSNIVRPRRSCLKD